MGKFVLKWLDESIEDLFVEAAKAVGIPVSVRLYPHVLVRLSASGRPGLQGSCLCPPSPSLPRSHQCVSHSTSLRAMNWLPRRGSGSLVG